MTFTTETTTNNNRAKLTKWASNLSPERMEYAHAYINFWFDGGNFYDAERHEDYGVSAQWAKRIRERVMVLARR